MILEITRKENEDLLNTIYCERYGCKMTIEACIRYSRKNYDACRGCKRAGKVQKRGWMAQYNKKNGILENNA